MANLKEIRAEKLANAHAIVEAAKDRDFTDDETLAVETLVEEVKQIDEQIMKVKASQELVTSIKQQGVEFDGVFGPTGQKTRLNPATLGDTPRVVGAFMKSARQTAEYNGSLSKSLVPSGAITVPADVRDLVSLARYPDLITPLIPTQPIAVPTFAFLQQTVRTNAAAPVAVGAVKPTSVLSLQQVNGQTETIAHLSEPIPLQWLDDAAQLQQFIQDEMAYGLLRALEGQVVNGSGVSPALRGILQTSGILTQAAIVPADKLGTLRTALTALETAGETPTAIVMHPQDWQAMESLRDTQSRYILMDLPQGAPSRTLFGLPVVSSIGMAVNTALIGDFTKATLYVRQGIDFSWGAGSLEFSKNQVIFRSEMRAGLAVERPGAFNKVALV